MEFTSLHEHIKQTSTCGVILTKKRPETDKDSYTTTAVQKTHMEQGRKGREAIRSGQVQKPPVP